MNGQTRVSHPLYHLLPADIEGFDVLAELALDMRWAWNHASDQVWEQLDPALWRLTHNPWAILQTVARDRIERVLADPVFRRRIDELLQEKRRAAETPAWFQQAHPQASLGAVAFFSMEFMLSEALPIYAGGTIQSRVREAASQGRQASLDVERLRRSAQEEIRSIYVALDSDRQQIKLLTDATLQAKQNLREETREYNLGLVTNIDVLQALTSAVESQRALDRTKATSKYDYARLLAASAHRPDLPEKALEVE